MRIDLDNCRDPDLLAGEVRRLQAAISSEQTLTDKEREAVRFAATAALPETEKLGGVAGELCRKHAATLRGLLERHFPVPENPPPQDNAPETHSNQSEVSVRPECAISPPWMARPFYVDPAAGWSYGFPKLYDPATDGDLNAWLVANGYPRYLADQNLPCTFTAKIDSQ